MTQLIVVYKVNN